MVRALQRRRPPYPCSTLIAQAGRGGAHARDREDAPSRRDSSRNRISPSGLGARLQLDDDHRQRRRLHDVPREQLGPGLDRRSREGWRTARGDFAIAVARAPLEPAPLVAMVVPMRTSQAGCRRRARATSSARMRITERRRTTATLTTSTRPSGATPTQSGGNATEIDFRNSSARETRRSTRTEQQPRRAGTGLPVGGRCSRRRRRDHRARTARKRKAADTDRRRSSACPIQRSVEGGARDVAARPVAARTAAGGLREQAR